MIDVITQADANKPTYDAAVRKIKDFFADQKSIEVVRLIEEAFRNNERLAEWKLKMKARGEATFINCYFV